MTSFRRHVLNFACGLALTASPLAHAQSLDEIIASKTDLWAEAALKQPNGPTYDYFEKLLPPLRYVDADFRCYPIVLSAPSSLVKGRLVSDGSAINALARQPTFVNEMGTPITIHVGDDRTSFGRDLAKVVGPHLADGFLPIVTISYTHQDLKYSQEVFASVDETLSKSGAILAKFDIPKNGRLDLRVDLMEMLKNIKGKITDKAGDVYITHDDHWEWNPAHNLVISKADYEGPAYVLIMAKPAADAPLATAELYQQQRKAAEKFYRDLLAKGANFEVPEPIVNNAWRNTLLQNFGMIAGNQMNYSAGNQYARQYAHESGESQHALILFGHGDTARRTFKPLFIYRRANIEFHDGAFKLIDLAFYHAYTHDDSIIEELKPLWQKEVDLLINGRESLAQSTGAKQNVADSENNADTANDVNGTNKAAKGPKISAGPHDGLLPREKYCSDIDTRVHSLNANADSWRGLRDMAIVLHDEKLAALAADYRKTILAAVDKAIVRNVNPPFIPIALDGEEDVHDPITATRIGSYWNLVVQSLLGTGVFPYNSEYASDIINFMQQKGGLCMGMIRVQSVRGTWMHPQNIDDLYGTRYAIALLQRDDPDRALVSFYGKLAQGFTRETFEDGESTSIIPTDQFGRIIALPPNTTANAYFLQMFRFLLVQDFDMDDDGKPETLRLLFATPRQWLQDGKTIKIERAPTTFGPISCIVSRKGNQITADISLPKIQPQKTQLRLRLPNSEHVTSTSAGKLDNDVIDLTGMTGELHLTAELK